MQIVHASALPIEHKQSGGRVGSYRRRVVMRGKEGDPGNFSLILYYQDGSFESPRHRHSFDQFRYQIDGDSDFSRNGKMSAGVLAYFPEGAHYGPQFGPPHTVAVLQFGGPSGSGYLSNRQTKVAREELNRIGSFEGGIFRRHPGIAGKKAQDGYEAVWEHVYQRKLVYPEPQYSLPIMMDTNHWPWTPFESSQGIVEQALGVFTHCRIRAARYKFDAGAEFIATGRGIYMVLSGAGILADQTYQELSTLYLDDGETATFKAGEETIILLMGLPSIALMKSQQQSQRRTQAAE